MIPHDLVRFMDWFCLKGPGYQFWSGIGIVIFMPFSFALGYWKHHNCHVNGCWRVGKLDPLNHHPACRIHHSHAHLIGDR